MLVYRLAVLLWAGKELAASKVGGVVSLLAVPGSLVVLTCCVLSEGKKTLRGKRAANNGESDSFGKLYHISILCVWSLLVLSLLSCHSHQNNCHYHWHNYISCLSVHIITIIIAGNSKTRFVGNQTAGQKKQYLGSFLNAGKPVDFLKVHRAPFTNMNILFTHCYRVLATPNQHQEKSKKPKSVQKKNCVEIHDAIFNLSRETKQKVHQISIPCKR